MSCFEENEISAGAHGGTEIAKRRLAEVLPNDLQEHFQVIPSRPRSLKPDKIRVLWCHDLPTDPEVAKLKDPNYRDTFHAIVFVSNWQYEQFRDKLGIPYSERYRVLESGIDRLSEEVPEKPTDVVNLAYTSTPQRGLAILLPVFEKLADGRPDVHLDVFSSFKLYGWDEHDKNFQELYDRCERHPKVTYHGFKPNSEVRERLKSVHVHAYPCTWPETSCRAMLEAMSEGCLCVHPNFSGLTDTSGGLNLMYPGDQDPNIHANMFYIALDTAVQLVRERDPYTVNRLKFNKAFVDTRFNFHSIAASWDEMMRALLLRYPTVESR